MGRPATDKRQRLVAAAIEQFHVKGVGGTSLADVARGADIPAGNVFYYFKTKDDLVRAVADRWCGLLSGYLQELDGNGDPMQRIEGFIDQACVLGDMYVALSCPLAGLTRDLRQGGGSLAAEAARIYAVQVAWLEGQFAAGGFSHGDARAHTRFLMAGHHGAILLAHAQGDRALIEAEAESLKRWLWGLSRGEVVQVVGRQT